MSWLTVLFSCVGRVINLSNPLLFAAGILFVGAAVYAFLWQKDVRIGIMSIGLAIANCALGW